MIDETDRRGEGVKTGGGWSAVAAELRSAIGEGRHAPGSRLPSERALSEQFGVSRVTMRRAIAELDPMPKFGKAAELPVTVNVYDSGKQLVFRAVINMWISPKK